MKNVKHHVVPTPPLVCYVLFSVVSILYIIYGNHILHMWFDVFLVMNFGVVKVLIILIYLFFIVGSLNYFHTLYELRKYFKHIKTCVSSQDDLFLLSELQKREIPHIGIFVPARNEGFVIANTIRRLEKMDYPKHLYSIFIIVDERELDDPVEKFTKDVFYETTHGFEEKYGPYFAQCIEVPKWYSGVYGDMTHTFEKSTKGRALNYALQYMSTRSEYQNIELIGVLDADGRLDPDVLKEVAHKRLTQNSKILQGPVFQVSNFSQITVIGIMAGLELAIHHMTALPSRLLHERVQFLAGTNYFIDRGLIASVGAWNQYTMVEDAELALRIYIQHKIKAEWLSCPEIEQSPENFRIYKKQRERWVRGHLELLRDIIISDLSLRDKISFVSKILISQFRFLIDFCVPVLALFLLIGGFFNIHTVRLSTLSLVLFFVSICIWDMYGMMYRKLSKYINPKMSRKDKIVQSIILFVIVPLIIVVQAIPRFEALINFIFYRKRVTWYKTERTRELVTE